MKVTATSVDTLRKNSKITSIRLINRLVEEICAALPQSLRAFAENHSLCDQWSEECEYGFLSLSITPAVGEYLCSQIETLVNLFVQCSRLSALFELLKRWFQGPGGGISLLIC